MTDLLVEETTLPTVVPADVECDLLGEAVATAGSRAWVGRGLTAPLRKLWLDVDIVGLENVPTEGGVVLAANHLAFIDSLLVMYSLDRPVSFLGKAEYLDHPVARRLFPMTGMLPLDRTGKRARVTLRRVQEILAEGAWLACTQKARVHETAC